MYNGIEQVFGDVVGSLGEERWGLVYTFFHPELREQSRGKLGLGSIFDGLLSEAAGIVGAATPGSVAGFSLPDASEPTLEVPATIVFEAYGIARRSQYWRAEIALCKGLPIGEAVVVSVVDAEGAKIERATLKLLGSDLSVSNGLAAYDLMTFQHNLKNTEVALVYPTGECVEGTLKFGAEEGVRDADLPDLD